MICFSDTKFMRFYDSGAESEGVGGRRGEVVYFCVRMVADAKVTFKQQFAFKNKNKSENKSFVKKCFDQN